MVDVPLAPAPEGVDDDAWAAACAAVRAYCGWHVAPVVTETVTLDGRGRASYFLPTLRLVDLVSVAADGAAVVDPEWSVMGEVRGVYSDLLRGIVAVMEHGYADCPFEVLTVLRELSDSGVPSGATSIAAGPYKVSFGSTGTSDAALLPAQRSALDAYRIVQVM